MDEGPGNTGPANGIGKKDPVIGTTANGTDDIMMDVTGTGIDGKIGPGKDRIGINGKIILGRERIGINGKIGPGSDRAGIDGKIDPGRDGIGIDDMNGLEKDLDTQTASDQDIPAQKRVHDETDQGPLGQPLLTSPKLKIQ